MRRSTPSLGTRRFLHLVLIFLSFSLLGLFRAEAQPAKAPEWKLSFSKSEVKQCDEIELIFKADIPDTWYVYSNDMAEDIGPSLPIFDFKGSTGVEFIGKPKPVGNKKVYDDTWEAEVSKFVKHAEFRQKVKITDTKVLVKVAAEYQMCSDITGMCILYDYKKELAGLKVAKSDKPCSSGARIVPANDVKSDNSTTQQNPALVPAELPASDVVDITDENPVVEAAPVKKVYSGTMLDDTGTCKPKVFIDDAGNSHQEEKGSLWLFAIVAFIGGLAGLLTPCVFPMIPMTVTFFLKNAKSRRAGIFQGTMYGLSIVAIYTLIGTVFTLVFGATGANDFATNATVNIIFFVVFVIFAISFFGAFEITLPSSFVNKMDKQSDRGGLIGVFFMAFTLVLVSFSCTGPIVGTILVEAAQGGILRPVIGMIGFSLAFALPFTLFAMFPQWLNTLPKSGGWLNSVKVVLGFVELALGLKFLSVADQVMHWGILDREIYIGLWIVLAVLCGLYLIGKLKFSHDSDLKHISVPRLFFAIASFSFVFYLIPGLFGAALPGLAGYLPPTTSHGFNLPMMINSKTKGNITEQPKYADFLHLPHGIKGYFEYKQAISAARDLEKPLFIDFTGHGCVNCRKMEDKVWANPEILKMLQEDFVVVALYVDDRKTADSSDWLLSRRDGELKTTIGKINQEIQICNFNHIAQPYYVLLDNEEELLAEPVGAEYDVATFRTFLEGAKKRFEKKKKAAANG